MDSLPEIKLVEIEQIKIPDDRQRNKAEADEQLINSIERLGVLNPIIIHNDMTLLAGERRLDACKKLGYATIPARIFEALPPLTQFEIELQENIARKQLCWQEEVIAINRYHKMRIEDFPGWTMLGTANALGFSSATMHRYLAIAAESHDPSVFACPTMTGAFNLITARAHRAKIAAQSRGLIAVDEAISLLPANMPANATKEERTAALLANIKVKDFAAETVEDIDKNIQTLKDGKIAEAALAAATRLELVSDIIINADFVEWASAYDGPKFDVLHIDFPYGKGYSGARTRTTGKETTAPQYDDDPDIYINLVKNLLSLQDNITYPAAHCLFWFDLTYYQWTIEQFISAGWTLIQPYPFIWSKGYQGIASDTSRRPRHVYETALMFSRGDRRLVKLDKDTFDCPVDEKLHLNQKPQAMLRHLLSMFVDEHTAILDPTCGSGSALAAAKQLGANRILGVEVDQANADVAKFFLQRVLGNIETGTDNKGKSP